MARSIELARLSGEHGNHPFGCVITARNGELVAESENTVVTDFDPTGHGEINAIRNACKALGTNDLTGCTLYTSCEPCWMCSTAIRRTGIARVVYAVTSAPRGGGHTSEYPILSAELAGYGPAPEILDGFMVDESAAVWKAIGWPRG
jgi:tRNA(Arg) A34 adenosine deaminase TadA